MYEIVPARLEHIRTLARTMRTMDRAEIEGWGLSVRHTLHGLWRDSPVRRAALVDGEVAAVWGVQASMMTDDGQPWLFTAPAIERAKLAFLRETKCEIHELLGMYRRLRCYVLAIYTQSIRFFEAMGFTIGPAEPVGRDGTPYRLMTIERDQQRHPPFIVLGLPRSRTYWLSRLLSYGDWHCYHEAAITMRNMEDVKTFFARPRTGTAETAAAPGWQILRHYIPDLRTVVVRRPVDEVVDAMMRTEGAAYDQSRLRRNMEGIERSLDKVARHKGVLSVDYADLDREDVCASIFVHCLPYEFSHDWWSGLRDRNLQVDPMTGLRYYTDNRLEIETFKIVCKSELWRLARAGLIQA